MKPKLSILCLVVALLPLVATLSSEVHAATFTVSSMADSGPGTLRQAITDANANGVPDTINFGVSGTISPTSALPDITDDGTVIDASSQWAGVWPDGQPGLTLDGSGAGLTSGLIISGASNCRISGLSIINFQRRGILITQFGFSGADSNIVGGLGSGERNVIYGNDYAVLIDGANTDNNRVLGNYLGTDATGSVAPGNTYSGIAIIFAQSNTIGGTTADERNIISGNGNNGVMLHGADGNVISGNYIGTDATGTVDLGNTGSGVSISDGAQSNIVGGTTPGERNLLSGNRHGVSIYGVSTSNNTVSGNHIGTDVTGTSALGNSENGVRIFGDATSNTIGGITEAAGNVITSNGGNGIVVTDVNTDYNRISHNSIYDNSGTGVNLVDGGNDEIPAPLARSDLVGNTLTVSGYNAGASGTVEVFKADSAVSGEGEIYLGSLTADANGDFSNTIDVTGKGLLPDDPVVCTTTHTDNNTSEFGLFDNIPPETQDDYDGEWHNENFYIVLAGVDNPGGSGLESINYRLNDGIVESVSSDGHPRIRREGDDNKLEYWGIDRVGNEEAHHIVRHIKLDKTEPTTEDDYNGQWHNGDFTITLTYEDDRDGSGIEGIYYRINNGGTESVDSHGHPRITTEGRNNKLEYWGEDNAGNEEEHHVLVDIKLDKTEPVTSDDYDGEWHNADFYITLISDDGTGSGVSDIRYRINNGDEKSVLLDEQPLINAEGGNNQLEYWSIDIAGNSEEPHHIVGDIKLDRTSPAFSEWQYPMELSQVYQGAYHAEVTAADTGGSGLSGEPLFDYHIGDDTDYDGYEAMTDEGEGVWSFDITAEWSEHPDEMLYFKAQASDVAGNVVTSHEFAILIERKYPPSVEITSTYRRWERGTLTVKAEASDSDGVIQEVLFQYSLDGDRWYDMGTDVTAPYSVSWNTVSGIPTVHDGVRLQAVATDNDDLTGQDVIGGGFGIDNETPKTSDNYDGEWHRESYTITLTGDDGTGSGIWDIKYKLNNGEERSVSDDGHPIVDEEGDNSKLEYWGMDNAGNEEEHHILSNIKPVDATPPEGSLVINNASEYTNTRIVTLALSPEDGGSGMDDGAQMRFSNDNVDFTEAEPYITSKEWQLPEGDGVATVYVQFSDAIENWTSVDISDTIILDTTPPECTIAINGGNEYCKTTGVILKLSATDNVSEIAEIMFSNDNITFSIPEAYTNTKTWELTGGDGTKTVYVRLSDVSGNWNTVVISDTIVLYTPSLRIDAADEAATENDSTVGFQASFFDPLFTHTAIIHWGDGNTDSISNVTSPFTATHTYPGDDGSYVVKVTVTDDGGGSMEDSFLVTVSNVPPVVKAGEDQVVNEGDAVSINATFTDGGLADTHIAMIDWGDGVIEESVVTESEGSGIVTGSHSYPNDAIYTLTVTVTDDDEDSGSSILVVGVRNSTPSISAGPGQDVSEDNPSVTISASFTDSGVLDTHTATINWGDSNTDSIGNVTSPFTATHTYPGDDGSYVVKVTVTDDGGGSMEDSFLVTVSNVPPVVKAGEDQVVNEGDAVSINATFTDGGLADTHIAMIDWGDGVIEESVVTESEGSGIVTGSHSYPNDAIYTLTVTVTDDDGDSGKDKLSVSITPPPIVTSISPGNGVFTGGTSVTITGENFQVGATVSMGGIPASGARFVSETEITTIAPTGSPGSADVVVVNPDGQAGKLVGSFIYIGPVARVSVIPQTSVVQKGEVLQLSVSGGDELGSTCQIGNTDMDWDVKNSSVGTIDENGLFTATGFGKTEVFAVLKTDDFIRAETEIEVPDTEPPEIMRLFPDFGEQNVPVTSEIQIEFSELVNVEVAVKGENYREIEGESSFDKVRNVLIFTPDEPFRDEEVVAVVISTVEDLSGNRLEGEFEAEFTTGMGVWPGDTNNDGYVNVCDIVPIGKYWHRTGSGRSDTTSAWELCSAVPWKPDKMAAYADANGDGVVNEYDILPLANNWSLAHLLNQLAAPQLVAAEHFTSDLKMLGIYRAMYGVLDASPLEMEGVRALKLVFREMIADIEGKLVPEESKLLQNYPNPFNPETWIPYHISIASPVLIRIHNASGRLVRTLDLGYKDAGIYVSRSRAAYWDGKNESGEAVANGIYFYTIQAGDYSAIRKMTVMNKEIFPNSK